MHPTPGCECPRCVPPEVISDLPPMHTISVDLIGSPKNVASVGGCRWAIVIIDRGTRYCWVKGLQRKSDARAAFAEFYKLHRSAGEIKRVYSDSGGEFLGQFSKFCDDNLIPQYFSCPYSPWENSVVERLNYSLKKTARCMLLESPFGDEMWIRALHTASVVHNQHVNRWDRFVTPHDAFWQGTRRRALVCLEVQEPDQCA